MIADATKGKERSCDCNEHALCLAGCDVLDHPGYSSCADKCADKEGGCTKGEFKGC
jgi:hypothetical protein